MTKILIHPELIELAHILRVADIDYEDMKGSNDSHEFADRARKAQQNLRCRKAELEGEGVEIWGDDLTPNAKANSAPGGIIARSPVEAEGRNES